MFERREMTIGAEPGRLWEVRAWAESAAAEFGFGPDDRYMVILAVSEAVTNAIEHGSGSPQDDVRVVLTAEGPTFWCEVHDTGKFVSRGVLGDEEDERGRGLEIVALTMDSLQLERARGGSRLCFSKRLA